MIDCNPGPKEACELAFTLTFYPSVVFLIPVLILLASFPSCGIFLVNLQVTISAKDNWFIMIHYLLEVCC